MLYKYIYNVFILGGILIVAYACIPGMWQLCVINMHDIMLLYKINNRFKKIILAKTVTFREAVLTITDYHMYIIMYTVIKMS